MNDAKFDYGMTAMSALMKGAQAEKKLPSSEKKLTASPVPEGKQYLKDQKEQIEKDILHIKDDNFTEENEELIYSEGAAAEESEAQARESAEEIAEAQEEEKRNKRNRRKSVIKLVVIAISITIVIIIGSIAWFTMNRDVRTSGMGVKTAPAPFELEVSGLYVENEDDFSKADSEYDDGEAQLEANTYRTSGQYGKIIWRKTGNTADDGHYAKGLEPNSHGKLTFWVIPNSTGTLDIEFDFNIRGFIGAYTDPEDEEEDPELSNLYEINDDLTVANSGGLITNASQLADKKAALEYIQGHILFFSDYDSTTHYYSGFLGTGRSIRFGDCINPSTGTKYNAGNPVSVTEGQKYQVTIYWKWANTFEQMVFDENSPKKDNPLFVSTNTADRTAIYSYLNAAENGSMNNKVFKDLTPAVISTNLGYIQNNTTGYVDNATRTLTDAYNNADSFIGNNIDYILIEMTADID